MSTGSTRVLLAALAMMTLGGCSPSSLAYLSLEDARIVNRMRFDQKFADEDLAGAIGVAVLDVTTVGIGVGVTAGSGVVLQRSSSGWSTPLPVTMVTGSIGAQLGGKNAKVLIIFRTQERFDSFVYGGAKFVAQVEGTAGPADGNVGGPLTKSDVEVISKVDGLYGGAVIGGFGVVVNKDLMRKAYGPDANPETVLSGGVATPAGADALWSALGT
jgi:lipid-binding SYLF domain-containing protein